MTDSIVTYMYGEDVAEDLNTYVMDDTVNIPRGRYEDLLEAEAWNEALDAAGVDNWDGIDYAQEIFNAFNIRRT